MSDIFSFLRKVPLFADLPEDDLRQICEKSGEMRLARGETLFTEGSAGHSAYIIKEGQIEIFKDANGKNVQLAVRLPGEVIGETSLLEATTRNASGRALCDSVLVVVDHEQIKKLLDSSPSAARTMLYTITSRLRSTELQLHQSEKMAQLGTLTAGIAHELNNPSSAVKRGAEHLKTTLDQYQEVMAQVYHLELTAEQAQAFDALSESVRRQATAAPDVNAITRSDHEVEIEDWLEGAGVENGWELAPQLSELGYEPGTLKGMTRSFPADSLPVLLRWMAVSSSLYRLFDEVSQGATRISEIVKALKSYVYLDQGPVQAVNIHDGLDSTLVILRHKLKQGIEVIREYDPSVPPIMAYGSELNQVWTNIIDNAIDAMDGKGRIRLRTAYQDPWVKVEIEDNGPGIPKELLPRLFSPFFTTKPVGKGTGLGLNISYNIVHKHGGEVKVVSQPGQTRFEVWLPVDFKRVQSGEITLPRRDLPSSELQNNR